MAGIDYSIPGQFKGIQLESPMNAMTQAMQLRGLQESSQMNALRMQEQALKTQETQETSRQRNALAAYLANPKKPTDALELEAGVRKVAPLLADQWVDAQLKRGELEEKINERGFKNFERKFKLYQSVTPNIRSIDDVSKFVAASYQDPDLGPILKQIRPYEDAINANQDAFNEDPDNWRLQAAGVSAKDIAEIARNRAKEEREANKPVVLAPGGVLVSPSGNEIFKAPDREKESNLARLQRELADIVKENPDDPRIAQYKAAITKETTTNLSPSDLARKQNELEILEAQLLKTPNDKKLREKIEQYRKDIKKDTEYKPSTVVVQAPTLAPDAIDMNANRFLVDGTLPQGISKANRDAIINRASVLAKEKGLSADRISQLEVTANKQALGQLSKTETMVGAFEKNFVKNVKIVENLNKKRDSTGIPLLQKWINVGKKAGTGDPDLAAINVAIKAVVNEYGKIVSGSMGNTAVAVSEIKRMEDLLNAAQNPEDVQAVLNVMRAETQNRMEGFKEQRAELTTSMRSSTTAPAAKPNAPAPYTDKEKERRYQEWVKRQGANKP